MGSRHVWLLAISALFALGGTACSKDEPKPKTETKKASIVSFVVAPETTQTGGTVTATWETRDAVSISLSANGVPVELGDAKPASGSVEVEVREETEFVLEATDRGGDKVSSTRVVTVEGDGPVVVEFTSNPATLEEAGTVMLSWRTRNADSIRITRSAGGEVDLAGKSPAAGNVTVGVEGTETFTLVASREAETDQKTTTVVVKGSPEASISISPALVTFGESTVIEWETSGAAFVQISDEQGNPLEGGAVEVSGSRTIHPAATTTYLLTAVGATGKETKVSAKVEVKPLVLTFEATDPSPAAVGDPKELSWKTGGATEVEVSNLEDDPVRFTGAAALDGTATLPMGAQGTFRIVAKSGPLTAEKSIEIGVLTDPVIGSFTVNRDVVSVVDGTATVSLSWTGVARAEQLELVGDTTGPIALGGVQSSGTIDVDIDADTVFTLTARNGAGAVSLTAAVRAVPLPVVESFTALPAYVGPGEEVEVAWSTTGAAQVEILQNGVKVPGTFGPSGAVLAAVAVSSTFEIVAQNDALDTVSRTANVTVGAPQITRFEASAAHVWVGGSVVFSWDALGGSSLQITSSDGSIHSTTDRGEIASGATLPFVVSQAGTFTFTLEVKNLSGQASTRTVTVKASTGPGITSFSVGPAALLEGTQVSVSWSATPDPDGNQPSLALTADRGGPYTLPAGTSGTAQFTLAEVGGYTFTLTASTAAAGSTPATRTQSVQVHGVPSVGLSANPTVFDDEIHSNVTLTWTSANADQSLRLFVVDAGGSDVSLYDVPVAERASGSFVAAAPTAATTYRIVGTNGLAMTAQAQATVTLQPAEILTFTATPPVYADPPVPPTIGVVAGDDVVLDWTTHKATTVSLDILSGLTFTETTEPFVDVSTTGTKATLTHAWCCTIGDEGQGVITFPAGFTFPFGGADRTQAMVYANGLISFDVGHLDVSGATSFTNEGFATTAKSWAHLAIFWDDLKFQDDTANGDIWYGVGTDAQGDYLAVQWKSIDFATPTADMNFEILLRPNGSFEYRYGTMAPISATAAQVNGNGATIGYMLPGRASFHEFSRDTAVPGGLQNRSFRYDVPPSLTANGSYAWRPVGGTGPTNRSATLTARNASGSDTRTITVQVHPRATLTATAPTSVIRNQNIRIDWTTTNATSVEVVDDQGATRCTAASGQIASGNCVLTEATVGPKTYTVVATGALGFTATKVLPVTVTSNDFGIESFTASAASISFGDPVTLSWKTGDADTLQLLANGSPVALPPTIDLSEDSFTLTPAESTTYELTIENTLFGTRSKTVSVTVRTATVTLTPSATTVTPGQPVTISWAASALDGGSVTVEVPFLQMVEDTSGPGFQDISLVAGVATLIDGGKDTTVVNHTLAGGFTFPFRGTNHTSLRVSTDGYVSFDSSTTTAESNQVIPSTSTTDRKANLAPFWDNLHTRTSGRVYAAMVGADYVIQWTGMSPTSGSSNADEWNLNFQVVLHPDGTFEYRYGTMAPRTTTSTSCFPDTCLNEANGSSATIGYQNAAGTEGATLHFGGTSNAAGNLPFSGGLANRTFRYAPPAANGSTTFQPRASGDYKVCVKNGLYTLCETISVSADFKIDSFDVSAASIEWGQNFAFSWATKGADALAIKVGANVIVDDSTVPIAAGGFTYAPAETATYTLEAKNLFLNKTVTATKTVTVRQFQLGMTSSATTVNPGDPVTLTWTATMLSGGTMALATPMSEVTGTVAYSDISTAPGVTQLIGGSADGTMADLTFANGFTFDYLGTTYPKVRVGTDGFLTFDASASTTSTNVRIPTTTGDKKIHLAPFWDDLNTRTNGRVYAAQVGADYVIQWSRMSMGSGSTSSAEHDLNFQVVLHADGSFDYVYGTMAGLAGTNTSSSCFPNTCVNEANGASATIGYQDPTGVAGQMVHFGGSSNSIFNLPFADGLSNRALRFTPHTASGSMVVNPTDLSTFRLCAISGATVECAAPVEVNAAFNITRFSADSVKVAPGQAVTLSWDTVGGDTIALTATVGTTETPLSISGFSGTYVDSVQANTTYRLTLGSKGRQRSTTVVVTLRNVDVTATATPQAVLSGSPTTLSWNVVNHTAGGVGLVVPMGERTGAGNTFADLDISTAPGVVQLHGATLDDNVAAVTFPNGFTFPYMGTNRTSMSVSVNGFVSFDPSTSSRHLNTAMPTTDSTNKTVHIAPFWDDLHTRTSGRVFGLLVDPDTYVVQWSHISVRAGSDATKEYDLNFLLVLRSDGGFEFRYGTMTPPATPTSASASCGTSTNCAPEAMAASATVAYQDPTGSMGFQLHFGGQSNSASNPSFPGGLANRTFAFEATLTGSTTIVPTASKSYKVCAIAAGVTECSIVDVVVPGAGSLAITELVAGPAGGAGNEWFEVKNLTKAAIDLSGWTISTTSGSHAIVGPLVVPSGGFATLAASATVGFTPDYVFGAALPFAAAADTLTLKAGTTTVASVTWSSTWSHPASGSLSLDGSFYRLGTVSNDDPTRWCTGASSPGAAGLGCKNALYSLDRYSDVPFIDISATGTRMPILEADGATAQVPVTFSMPYYGTTVSKIWANSNGWISFAPTIPANVHFAPSALPRTATADPKGPLVAAFWEDLGCAQSLPGGMWFQFDQQVVGAETVTILQWNNYLRCSNTGFTTFQVQLWSGGDVAIVFDRFEGASTSAQDIYAGSGAWVGLEGPNPTDFFTALYKQAALVPGQSILYRAK